jgi:hypothetical protein
MKSQLHLRKTFYVFIIPVLTVIFISTPIFIDKTSAEGEYLTYLPIVQNCPAPTLPLVNGGFEQGDFGWTLDPYFSGIGSSEGGITPHGGNMLAYVTSGGMFPAGGYIEQSFTVPMCAPYLSFWWSAYLGCITMTGHSCQGSMFLEIDGTQFVAETVFVEGIKPWENIIVDLSSYRGSNITIRFKSAAFLHAINNYFDDITFQNYPYK